MVERLRQRPAHQPRGAHRAIGAGELDAGHEGGDPVALPADPPSEGAVELHLHRRIRAIAELVLEALKLQRVHRPVRPEARDEKGRGPVLGLREREEGVAHRRRDEPLVSGDRVAVLRRLRAGDVRPHIGAALPLGHGDAERQPELLLPWPEARVVVPRHDLLDQLGRDGRLARERGDRGPRHRDRVQVPVLDLRHHVAAGRARHLGRGVLAGALRRPGRGVQVRPDALLHEMMVGGMILDHVAAEPLGVERVQLGQVLVGEPRLFEHVGGAPAPPERGEHQGFVRSPIGRDRFLERLIARVEIDIEIRGRLVEPLLHSHHGFLLVGGDRRPVSLAGLSKAPTLARMQRRSRARPPRGLTQPFLPRLDAVSEPSGLGRARGHRLRPRTASNA